MSDIIIPESNLGGDRIYGSIFGHMKLVNKDGTEYSDKIEKKSISVEDINGNKFLSYVYVTKDNRWFDRCGMPIDKPKNLITRDKENGE